MDYKNVLKKEKGITLVALVITVILMLILAGVAISVLTEDGGLFGKAKNAADLYEMSAESENKALSNLMNTVDKYLSGLGLQAEKEDNPKVKPAATVGVLMTENQTYDGRLVGTYNNPIIPKGFAAINENGANWGTADGYKYGLVITDAFDENTGKSTGNEFVWVPVDGKEIVFSVNDWKDESGNSLIYVGSFSDYIEVLPVEITNSIDYNKGFYVARYENGTGNVSKKGVSVIHGVNWGYSKEQAEGKYTTDNINYGVVSTLMYGAHWDTTLKFILAYGGNEEYANFIVNSTGRGNCSTGDSYTSTSTPTTCGATTEFMQKNIYDMAGNVWEWTMEGYGASNYVPRGGCYMHSGDDYPVAYRSSNASTYSDSNVGFRMALYIKN